MTKKPDISRRVMDQVVRYEERNAITWRTKFLVVLVCLFGLLAAGIYLLIQYFSEYQLFALFELFQQDREIIIEYWQDTLSVIWDETPKDIVFLGLCVCGMIIIYILATRKKRNILNKKMQQISAYRSKSAK